MFSKFLTLLMHHDLPPFLEAMLQKCSIILKLLKENRTLSRIYMIISSCWLVIIPGELLEIYSITRS